MASIFHKLAAWAVLGAPILSCAAPLYLVTPLGNLDGSSGDVRAINNAGQVAGHVLEQGSIGNAVLTRGGAWHKLHPEGAAGSFATGVNDAGVASGYIEMGGGRTRAVTFAGSSINELGNFGGRGAISSVATAINNSGQVAGSSDLPDAQARHAFRYTPGQGLLDLGTLGGQNSFGTGINSTGQVVGRSDVAGGSYHAFRYANGVMGDLGTLGGTFSEASGINDSGAVSGFSYLTGNANAHAFMVDEGVMLDLGTLGGANSFGYGINNRGQVVGSSEVAGGNSLHAFLYSEGRMIDLNTLVGPTFPWVLNYAADINEHGQIAAFGCDALSQCQGFLLTLANVSAIPEPSGPALLLLGLLVLGVARTRRRAVSPS